MKTKVKTVTSMKVISEIIQLHNVAWNNSTGIIDLLKNASRCFILTDSHNRVMGYAFVEEDKNRGFVELQDIVVSESYRGKGGGKQLMHVIMATYGCIKLICRIQNVPLVNFYKTLGFVEEFRIENYYEINEDGVRLSWKKR